jgi:hypothetical protein
MWNPALMTVQGLSVRRELPGAPRGLRALWRRTEV